MLWMPLWARQEIQSTTDGKKMNNFILVIFLIRIIYLGRILFQLKVLNFSFLNYSFYSTS